MNNRLAAIDIGSNSFHIVVVEINPETQSFKVLDRLKETVRFGSFTKANHELSKTDMKKGFETLKRFKKLAEGHHVSEIVACATSAVREAPNGKEWLKEVRDDFGIDAHPISGIEEARLIYLGVLSAFELKGRKAGMVDIGGGSTELVIGDEQFIYHLSSTKAGAVRLTEKYLKDESNSLDKNERVENLERHLESLFATKIEDAKKSGFDILIGTSGTVQTLAKIDYMANNFVDSESPLILNNYVISYDSICKIIEKMIKVPKNKIASVFDISKNRADIILAGAVTLKVVMKNLNANEIICCDRALREGLIVDKLLHMGIIKNRLNYQQTIRERSVYDLAQKYNYHREHAEQVKKLTLSIFNQTKNTLHNYGSKEQELLEAACILHDIGSWVSHNDHHKHTYYLIRHSGLLGFNEEEVLIIANIARYHRQANPKDSHPNFQNLPREHKKLVRDLSSILRIAEGLDKGHKSAIKDIEITQNSSKKKLIFKLTTNIKGYDCSLERWSAIGKSKDLQREFGVQTDFILEKAGKINSKSVEV